MHAASQASGWSFLDQFSNAEKCVCVRVCGQFGEVHGSLGKSRPDSPGDISGRGAFCGFL